MRRRSFSSRSALKKISSGDGFLASSTPSSSPRAGTARFVPPGVGELSGPLLDDSSEPRSDVLTSGVGFLSRDDIDLDKNLGIGREDGSGELLKLGEA